MGLKTSNSIIYLCKKTVCCLNKYEYTIHQELAERCCIGDRQTLHVQPPGSSTFLCEMLSWPKLFSLSFVPLLAPNPGDATGPTYRCRVIYSIAVKDVQVNIKKR